MPRSASATATAAIRAEAIVRASTDHIALALTLREDGDLEVVMPLVVCDDLIAALSEARRYAGPA